MARARPPHPACFTFHLTSLVLSVPSVSLWFTPLSSRLRPFAVTFVPMPPCDLCGRPLPEHGFYVVRIEVFADPSMPPTTDAALAATDFAAEIAGLVEQMQGMTADDLQDDVHRRFEYRVCRPCQRQVLANPLGKPRGASRPGEN